MAASSKDDGADFSPIAAASSNLRFILTLSFAPSNYRKGVTETATRPPGVPTAGNDEVADRDISTTSRHTGPSQPTLTH